MDLGERVAVTIAAAESIRLARLALEVNELADRLERPYLSDGAAMLLAPGLGHLRLGHDRIEQVVFEAVEMLDDSPRLRRLRDLGVLKAAE
jgi:hypothetical protein